ncbi:AGAP001272-PB [Anopheles gambiae str. PEST]|uniref:AGAP001272-PA n=1 Tax=Anopheles gambiae TaxID=7165 RepID=Q7PKK5_ANOGA|nr:AGAP001272-PA [Anopheles gambiae str. PEST]EGK97617.1 AGAP001272-PB [Anopheles gambiae str. PEST]
MLIATNFNQKQFIDSLCTNEAEDSSYDSDCDGEDVSHEQVSRTTSDTLGQEFAEYISVGVGGHQHQQQHHGKDVSPTAVAAPISTAGPEHSPGYQQRVEFALKLGYTEKLVQAALQRLGPNPAQNELLAELIKLGSQPGAKGGNEFTIDCHGHGDTGGLGLAPELATAASGAAGVGPSSLVNEESLRPIVIDGSNVAMSHGNKEVFSCRGIRLCVDWFKNRGHKDITVFVPKWRKESSRPDNPVKDGEILSELEKERMLVFTPSRLVGGKRMVCYDDRYILKLAADNDGIVVSNDNYRDLVQESSEFKKVVEERVLMYSFVNDRFMPPDDPLGRSGPTLDNFLRVQPRKGDPPPPCPYGKKCTYGNKCKFYHPERGSLPHKSVTERLSEYAARHLQARSGHDPSGSGSGSGGRSAVQGKSLSVPLSNSSNETSPINDKRKALLQPSLDQNDPSALVDSVNLHRKLQRQLTLNPAGCDPRIYQMQRLQQQSSQQQSQTAPSQQQQQQLSPHRPLAPSLSGGNRPSPPTQWELHQHVTRIASAPDSTRPWGHNGPPPASSSEPHINLGWSPSPGQGGPTPAHQQQQQHHQQQQQDRRRLHYHLASIFPEDQVQTVMQMYPDETNPQTICAAILAMYQKM